MSTGGEVANAADCKSVIHGFKSHPVLQSFPDDRFGVFDLEMKATINTNGALRSALRVDCLNMDMRACVRIETVGENAET